MREESTTSGKERQLLLFGRSDRPAGSPLPDQARLFPRLRYMGSKHRLLPWIHEVLAPLPFETALDAFAGGGSVAYLLKSMGKRVTTNDFLDFSHQIGLATVANSHRRLLPRHLDTLLAPNPARRRFIETTFRGIFFTAADLRFLDNLWSQLGGLRDSLLRALALSALVRACLKRQPRGVFTVAGDPERYKDGRRDLRMTVKEHFLEGVEVFNATVFDNGHRHRALHRDVFTVDPRGHDLVYLDPPYVPRSDDNCYIKRYHFLEGLVSYWQGGGTEIDSSSKVRKIKKRFTPFSYPRTAVEAFEALFRRFRRSIIVLSYSSSGWPDLPVLERLLSKHKSHLRVFERPHRYHFGTHGRVAAGRKVVREYLLVGS